MGHVIKKSDTYSSDSIELEVKTGTTGKHIQIETSGSGKVVLKPGTTGVIEAQGSISMNGPNLTVDGVDISSHNHSTGQGGQVSFASLSNTSHKNTHSTTGTDALSPSDIGAAPSSHVATVATSSQIGHVQIPANSGLSILLNGSLSVDFGAGSGQVSPGNHTHSSYALASEFAGHASAIPTSYVPGHIKVDTSISGLKMNDGSLAVNFAGTGASTVSRGDHTHSNYVPNSYAVYDACVLVSIDGYVQIEVQGTAFNKNFGTISGTVSQGNHKHSASDITSGDWSGTLSGIMSEGNPVLVTVSHGIITNVY